MKCIQTAADFHDVCVYGMLCFVSKPAGGCGAV